MKRTVALFYVGGLFLLGILIGALGMHLYYVGGGSPRPPFLRGGPGELGDGQQLARLERMLDLTPDQVRRIEGILSEAREEGRSIHEEMVPRVRAHMERFGERIEEVLTPEQRERFEEMRRRNRGRFERLLLAPPPPPPAPPPRRAP